MIFCKLRGLLRVFTILGILGAATMTWAGESGEVSYKSAQKEILKLDAAFQHAKQDGTARRYPIQFAKFEKRYLAVRGHFYGCRFTKATELAQRLHTAICGLTPTTSCSPLLNLKGPAIGVVGVPAIFDASDSSGHGTSSSTYTWEFGDGTKRINNRSLFTHTYRKIGTYTVHLTAAASCKDQANPCKDQASEIAQAAVSTKIKIVSNVDKVYFDLDSDEIKDREKLTVKRVIRKLVANPHAQANLVGHTDKTGTDAHNEKLSKDRAEVVKKALLNAGIKNRVTTDSAGSKKPDVQESKGKRGTRLNRRTVITLTPGKTP